MPLPGQEPHAPMSTSSTAAPTAQTHAEARGARKDADVIVLANVALGLHVTDFTPSSHDPAKVTVVDGARFFFRLSYLLGFKPWDSGISPPELVEQIEGPTALRPGRALDIGCGTGTNCQYMLDHGWDVTGVDYVPRALAMAKRKAPGAKLLVGDVTRLRDLGVSGPFDFMLDLGCFHSIPEARRSAYVREATAVAGPGATLLMFAFGEQSRTTPMASEDEIRRRFRDAFDFAEVRAGNPIRKQTWYRMIRKPA
jgi:SAM-dependent methyltransferase